MSHPLMFTLFVVTTLVGCSSALAPPDLPSSQPTTPVRSKVQAAPEAPAWVHQGRYTLASTRPTLDQRQPLLQMIEVHLPSALDSNVGQALRHVLQRSGYALCPDAPPQALLFSRPLPAVHLHLGPMTLLDALSVLGGPAWELSVDPLNRSVCYALRMPPPATPANSLEIAR